MNQIEQFSFFRRGNDSGKVEFNGNIQQFYENLRANSGWKAMIENVQKLKGTAQDQAKDALPAITASVLIKKGKLRGGLRDGDFVHTDLIQADFDESPNFDTLFQQLCQDPHTRLIFRSPRGKVKALVKVAKVETINDHDSAWQTLSEYGIKKGYGEIDPKPKNINSLCYISHDPNAILKDAEPLHWEPLAQLPGPNPTRSAYNVYDSERVDLTDWLESHGVNVIDTRTYQGNTMYLVPCPWESEHTEDFGAKDTAVFVDPTDGRWCFNCFHAHCEGRGWEDYRAQVAPRDTMTPEPYQHSRKPYSKTRARLNRTRAFYR